MLIKGSARAYAQPDLFAEEATWRALQTHTIPTSAQMPGTTVL
jgi:hypothetical protein